MAEEPRSLEREAEYYRRYCDELSANLFRLQEEQGRAFRSARRSRTVVKLLREAYRLADVAVGTHDIGGPMLELLVENTLCDRAVLLREEAVGSGMFLVAQAIGLADKALGGSISVPAPPAFLYTTAAQDSPTESANAVTLGIGVPFVLWAYDASTGQALVIGNLAETNFGRPFEAADQELIEAALSVYLDVLYRKTAEAQLREAKRVAQAAGTAQAAGLTALTDELRGPLKAIADLAGTLRSSSKPVGRAKGTTAGERGEGNAAPGLGSLDPAEKIVALSRSLVVLVDGASERPEALTPALSLDVEWVPVDELLRPGVAAIQAARATHGVDIDAVLPRRRTAVLVDRRRMQHVLQHLLASVVRRAPKGGRSRVTAKRRSDGGLELVMSAAATPTRDVDPLLPSRFPIPDVPDVPDGPGLAIGRAVMEAHDATLTVGISPLGRLVARVVLPAHITRDFERVDESWGPEPEQPA